jgi:hypothetical protein
MKQTLGIIVFLLAACASRSSHLPCHATPEMFCGVFAQIDDTLSQKDKETLRNASEQEIGSMHHDFGAAVRNSFHLWEENELTRYFRSIGVDHPDIMSGVLIRGYVAYLNGREANLAAIAQQSIPPPPPPEPPARP